MRGVLLKYILPHTGATPLESEFACSSHSFAECTAIKTRYGWFCKEGVGSNLPTSLSRVFSFERWSMFNLHDIAAQRFSRQLISPSNLLVNEAVTELNNSMFLNNTTLQQLDTSVICRPASRDDHDDRRLQHHLETLHYIMNRELGLCLPSDLSVSDAPAMGTNYTLSCVK